MRWPSINKNTVVVGVHVAALAGMVAFNTQVQRLIPQGEITTATLLPAMAFHYRWVFESLAIILAGVWLTSGGRLSRALFYVLACIFFGVNALQLTAVKLSQQFVSALALENIGHIHLLLNTTTVLATAGIGLALMLYLWWFERVIRSRPSTPTQNLRISLILVACAAVVQLHKFLPESVKQRRSALYAQHMDRSTPPIGSLLSQFRVTDVKSADAQILLAPAQIDLARKLGIKFYDSKQAEFPLVKDRIYSGPPPFVNERAATPQNVIVFFAEGIAADLLGLNNPNLPGITPNIDRFAQDSRVMVVDHYFNHTAATYRGITGELCSIYPTFGGYDGWDNMTVPYLNHLCLPHIFKINGYDNVFWDSHTEGVANINKMVKRRGFERVFNAEEMSRDFLGGEPPISSYSVSDQQLFKALKTYLSERLNTAPERPLFLGLYNLGTHANWPLATDGVPYKDGANPVLNNLHNFDAAFGSFYDWFRASAYAENTVLILTSDHTHYPEEGMISAAGSHYQPYFVGRIPLMVFDASRQRPKHFDANYSTSIDFAPSLLHYLGFANHRNPFLGTSIFEPGRKEMDGVGLANYGDEFFFVDRDGVHHNPDSGAYGKMLADVREIVNFSKRAETADRVWRRLWDSYFVGNPGSKAQSKL